MATNYIAIAKEGTERAAKWLEVFGSRSIYLASPEPVLAQLTIGERLCYLVDLPSLTQKQRKAMIAHICKEFELEEEEVNKSLDTSGCPIPVDDDITLATQASLADGWF